ncbi:Xylooligosaccharide oxidase [Drechslerella dactyloides]|uniref:Xylooligosaccharide oxidase n=1 Tax=Drechslerella dactyloides TaxID=74499 RepID=A0AAD6NLL5_DREDA|nr:Xylooligosaccharide oxidase [Drechslerella dactyloides]
MLCNALVALLPLLLQPVSAVPLENLHTRQQSTFVDCLSKGDVPIVLASDTSFSQLSSPYNRRLKYTPLTITLPTTILHISTTVKCASQFKIRVNARGGGHSYSAQALGGEDGHVVVDMQNFHDVVYNQSTTYAEVGGGARLGNIAQKLYDQAKRAIPHGTCPAVGMGHPSLGGFGISSRNWGLMVDSIAKVEVITADGRLRLAKPTYNGDLLWALRGAGPSFGIITKFYFNTVPATESIVNYSYSFSGLSASNAAAAFITIQKFALTAPKELGLGVSLWGSGTNFEMSGAYYGKTMDDFTSLFQPLLSQLPQPSSSTVNMKGWIDTLIRFAGASTLSVPETGYNEHTAFFAKSLVTPQGSPLTLEQMTSFFNYAATKGPEASNQGLPWFVIINLYGGGNSAITNTALLEQTSYGHRDTLWNFQLYATINNLSPASNASSITFVDGFDRSVRRSGDGAYVNYADPTLSPDESHTLYYGEQYAKLSQLKKKWDKNQVFWYPQGIYPAP